MQDKRVLVVSIVLFVASAALLVASSFVLRKGPVSGNGNGAGAGALSAAQQEREGMLKNGDVGCATTDRESVIEGDSLAGVAASGTRVKVIQNYYACHGVSRGDIVVYKYAGNPEPIIKIVKGVPGDSFDLVSASKDTWNILINKDRVENSEKKPYELTRRGYDIISLYKRDYKGVIPDGAYFLLGNDQKAGLDSRYFGLVGSDDFIGKAEIIQ